MRVIIAGSRGITDYSLVERAVKNSGFNVTEVVSGGARGVDKLGEVWAMKNDVPFVRFEAKWDKLGKIAGPIRNQEMVNYADCLISIWDQKSRGTQHCITVAINGGLDVKVFSLEGEQVPISQIPKYETK